MLIKQINGKHTWVHVAIKFLYLYMKTLKVAKLCNGGRQQFHSFNEVQSQVQLLTCVFPQVLHSSSHVMMLPAVEEMRSLVWATLATAALAVVYHLMLVGLVDSALVSSWLFYKILAIQINANCQQPIVKKMFEFWVFWCISIRCAMHTQAMAHKTLLTELPLFVWHVHCWEKLMRIKLSSHHIQHQWQTVLWEK